MADLGSARIHALFQKRLAGDDALLALARRRLLAAGIGAELYAADPGELEHLLAFAPSLPRPVVHLPRGLNLLRRADRQLLLGMANRGGERISGLVVHDQTALLSDPAGYRRGLAEVSGGLIALASPPWLFVEYALGLRPEQFFGFFAGLDLPQVSVCLDLGHLAIWQVRELYAQLRPGADIMAFAPGQRDPQPEVAAIVAAVEQVPAAVAAYFPLLLDNGKPLHLHLHDGHPLAPRSPYGVADHFGFFSEVPIDFSFQGRQLLPTIYGPLGLQEMVGALIRQVPSRPLSWTLEIHPHGGRLPLGEAAELFHHWQDLGSAEETNLWLDELLKNAQLLAALLKARRVA